MAEEQGFATGGFDWSEDRLTEAEWASMVTWYDGYRGPDGEPFVMPAFMEFAYRHVPGALKHYRRLVEMLDAPDPSGAPPRRGVPMFGNTLLFLHLYLVTGLSEGVRHEARIAYNWGITKAELLQTIELAWVNGGPMALYVANQALGDWVDGWPEDAPPSRAPWPAEWSTEPPDRQPRLDATTLAVEDVERDELERWYAAHEGTVPAYVGALLDHTPRLMKAQRIRADAADRGPLPAQFVALMHVHLAALRRRREGLHRATRRAIALGVGEDHLRWAVVMCVLHTGDIGMEMIFDTIRTAIDESDL